MMMIPPYDRKVFTKAYGCPICLSCNVSQVVSTCKHHMCVNCLHGLVKDNALAQVTDFSVKIMKEASGDEFPTLTFKLFPTRIKCPTCRKRFYPLHLERFWTPLPLPCFDQAFFSENEVEWTHSCPWCWTNLSYEDSNTHILSCPQLATKCSDCKQVVRARKDHDGVVDLRGAFVEHYEKSCTMLVSCPSCQVYNNRVKKIECCQLRDHVARHDNTRRVSSDLDTWKKELASSAVDVDSPTHLMQLNKYARVRDVRLHRTHGKMTFMERAHGLCDAAGARVGRKCWKLLKNMNRMVMKGAAHATRQTAKRLKCEWLLPINQVEENERVIRRRMLDDIE